MTLQKHINTVNENLMRLVTWLTGHFDGGESLLEVDLDNKYQTELGNLVQGSNASMGGVQHVLGHVAEDATRLISSIHADEQAGSNLNAVAVLPVLEKVANTVGKLTSRAK